MSAGGRLGGRLSRAVASKQGRRDSVLGRYDATGSGWRSSSADGHSSSRGPRGTGRRRVCVRCFGVESVAKKQLLAAEMR